MTSVPWLAPEWLVSEAVPLALWLVGVLLDRAGVRGVGWLVRSVALRGLVAYAMTLAVALGLALALEPVRVRFLHPGMTIGAMCVAAIVGSLAMAWSAVGLQDATPAFPAIDRPWWRWASATACALALAVVFASAPFAPIERALDALRLDASGPTRLWSDVAVARAWHDGAPDADVNDQLAARFERGDASGLVGLLRRCWPDSRVALAMPQRHPCQPYAFERYARMLAAGPGEGRRAELTRWRMWDHADLRRRAAAAMALAGAGDTDAIDDLLRLVAQREVLERPENAALDEQIYETLESACRKPAQVDALWSFLEREGPGYPHATGLLVRFIRSRAEARAWQMFDHWASHRDVSARRRALDVLGQALRTIDSGGNGPDPLVDGALERARPLLESDDPQLRVRACEVFTPASARVERCAPLAESDGANQGKRMRAEVDAPPAR